MKAAQRRKKREEEKRRLSSMKPENNDIPQNKLNIKASQESKERIENIPSSRLANNKDPEKVSQRMKEKIEQRRIQKLKEDLKSSSNEDFSLNNSNSINKNNENIKKSNPPPYNNNNNNNDDNINRNNTFFNNKKYVIDKESNKLAFSVESGAPAAVPKKVLFKIPSNKNVIVDNFNLNNFNNINLNLNDIATINTNKNMSNSSDHASTFNYYVLSKNIADIKNENIDEFLQKTQLEKPSIEQKESEVQNMIKIMNLCPKINNSKKQLNDSIYANILSKKIKDNQEYDITKKEIEDLANTVDEEEKKIEMMQEKNKEEIQKYIERILKLQNDLINSEQGDIVALEEENKIDKIQIYNLQMNLNGLEKENEKERNNMMTLINKEILPLQQELKNEILEVQKLKKQLLKWNKKTPPKDILKKIEVVMKYMKKHT